MKDFYEEGKREIHSTRATIAHEIGHLYGANHHYALQGDESIDNCIFGRYHLEDDVRRRMLICSECQATIRANKSRYNHD